MRRLLPAVVGALVMIASAAPAADRDLSPAALPSRPELPDPLVMFDGSKVTTKADWETKRRPELKELFQDVMYGRQPEKMVIAAKVIYENKAAFGGKATLREVSVSLQDKKAPPVYWLVVIPNKRSGPAPTFVGLNFGGNHLLTSDLQIHVPEGWVPNNYPGAKNNKATDEGRGKQADTWPLEQIVDHGYAVATAYSGDIIPDNHTIRGGWAEVIMPGRDGPPSLNMTATIMAWATGIHRGIDYLVTVPELDAKRIACVGHSRLGKTAILATAFDDRIALGIPLQAGCGGTSPDRMKNPKGETVKRITTAFPHWFAPAFSAFADDTSKLPFDQHCLAAICAPRPLLYANATDDQWADPPGQFEMLKAATPVYQLLGVDGLAANATPTEGPPSLGRLGYWVRPGKHAMTPADWDVFVQFADKWLK